MEEDVEVARAMPRESAELVKLGEYEGLNVTLESNTDLLVLGVEPSAITR